MDFIGIYIYDYLTMSHQLKTMIYGYWGFGESKSWCCTPMFDYLFCLCYAVIESGSCGMDGWDLLTCVGAMQENACFGYFFGLWWERDKRDKEY